MEDKIALLIEETGCDEDEAKLALEMCGYEVEEAIKAIARSLRNIAVLKGKFAYKPENQFGLFLVIVNIKTGVLLRCRAVLSFNPAVYAISLEKDWFEFEKYLYSCRLWEGSLQTESLEIERRLSNHFRQAAPEALELLGGENESAVLEEISEVFKTMFHGHDLNMRVRADILDLRQFQSLRNDPEAGLRKGRPVSRAAQRADEMLVLKVKLDEDHAGVAAGQLRVGDMVSATIVDSRDIAQYLAKLFGGYCEGASVPILAPVEAIELVNSSVLARIRFSTGVCGDATVPLDNRLKVVRVAVRHRDSHPWWRRLFREI